MKLSTIYILLKKEMLFEWRFKSSIGSLIVNLLATTFFIYLIFNGEITFRVWMAIFWIISLFSVIQSSYRIFIKDGNEHFYYLKNIASANEIIVSKIVYNTIFNFIISILTLIIMQLFFGQEIGYIGIFISTVLLASFGFASIFTLLSGITAKTQNVVLLGVLGLPIVLPLVLVISKLSMLADFYTAINDIYIFSGAALLLDCSIFILSIILFPYLWKE
ncbi:MAG: ABC transporter permease [Sphingobacteriales bacterium]|jgi:heme exporter protein B|nr:MAG: ABC transporter permease [Sphingobacteriales bacterium]